MFMYNFSSLKMVPGERGNNCFLNGSYFDSESILWHHQQCTRKWTHKKKIVIKFPRTSFSVGKLKIICIGLVQKYEQMKLLNPEVQLSF